MKQYMKADFPVDKIRRFLEPSPVVLISSASHSFEMIRRSKECVINIPEADLIDEVVGIGNTPGAEIDKFDAFKLTAAPAAMVKAPLIADCYANFESKLVDARLIQKYNYFILEVVKAHAARAPNYPRTVHYRGDGIFMVSGPSLSKRAKFKRENL